MTNLPDNPTRREVEKAKEEYEDDKLDRKVVAAAALRQYKYLRRKEVGMSRAAIEHWASKKIRKAGYDSREAEFYTEVRRLARDASFGAQAGKVFFGLAVAILAALLVTMMVVDIIQS